MCNKLAQCAQQSTPKLAVPHEIEKVARISDIIEFGVIITPALVVDDKILTLAKIKTVS